VPGNRRGAAAPWLSHGALQAILARIPARERLAALLQRDRQPPEASSTMPNLPKPRFNLPIAAPIDPVPDRGNAAAIVEALFDVLDRHQAGPSDGALALIASFVQGASRILELSAFEETEHNRESLLAMLDHARRAIDTWSIGAPPSGVVH
jgi:hypothetical protein